MGLIHANAQDHYDRAQEYVVTPRTAPRNDQKIPNLVQHELRKNFRMNVLKLPKKNDKYKP
jgi:hypothetical protein